MMTDEELKEAIIQYAKEYYEHNKSPPSLRNIIKRFRREKLNFSRFYKIFPKGVAGVWKPAGIPFSEERIKRTERATEAVKSKQLKTAQGLQVPFSQVFYIDEDGNKHTLDEWSNNIRGELLDLDSNIRRMMEDLASTMKKVGDLESNFKEKVFEALKIKCPHCGGKIVFNVTCLNCNERLLLQILK